MKSENRWLIVVSALVIAGLLVMWLIPCQMAPERVLPVETGDPLLDAIQERDAQYWAC